MDTPSVVQPPPPPPETPPAQPVPPPKPKNYSGILIVILLIVIAILVGMELSETTFFATLRARYLAPIPTPTPTIVVTPSPAPDPTANWKTYTSPKYNYTIEYPSNWYLDSSQKDLAIKNYLDPALTYEERMNFLSGAKPTDKISITLGVYDNPISGNVNLVDWLKTTGNYTSAMSGDPKSVKNTTIAGYPGLILQYAGINPFYVFQAGNRVFFAYYNPLSTTQSKTFDQILSTFTFTGQTTGTPAAGQRINCPATRAQVCPMLCLQPPPYLCGSDGKSYCSECQACSSPTVSWYITQDAPCTIQ